MDAIIDAQFARVEKALSTFITSISTSNPSPPLAHALSSADNSLKTHLDQLTTHQSNYARLVALRSQSDALDAQIKDTLTLLANTRAELLATPATVLPEKSNAVTYTELLSYARRISNFTQPPTRRDVVMADDMPAAGQNGDTAPTPGSTPSTPNLPKTNGNTPTPTPLTASPLPVSTPRPSAAPTATALPVAHLDWLNPHLQLPFTPYPSEETIRRGALASIQVLSDQGIDPASWDPERMRELEAERAKAERELEEEREKIRLEEEERARGRERVAAEARRGSGGREPAPVPAVFAGLQDLYDPDADDDD